MKRLTDCLIRKEESFDYNVTEFNVVNITLPDNPEVVYEYGVQPVFLYWRKDKYAHSIDYEPIKVVEFIDEIELYQVEVNDNADRIGRYYCEYVNDSNINGFIKLTFLNGMSINIKPNCIKNIKKVKLIKIRHNEKDAFYLLNESDVIVNGVNGQTKMFKSGFPQHLTNTVCNIFYEDKIVKGFVSKDE